MSQNLTVGNITVTIEPTCIDPAAKMIKFELLAEDNDGKTCFTANEDIYLRMYLSPTNLSINLNATIVNSVRKEGGLRTSFHEETITISNGTGTTNYPIASNFNASWHGTAPCPVNQIQWAPGYADVRCNQCATGLSPLGGESCEITFGVLNVSYNSQYRHVVLNVPNAGDVIVFAHETA